MPSFREDLEEIPVYTPGKPIEEVAAELGLSDIVKLASNECPTAPFPEVVAAVAEAVRGVNRYPETSSPRLRDALADLHGPAHGVTADHLWIGSGSSQLLGCAALAVGGPGTSAVFGDPSFVMYRIATRIAGSTPIAVPLDSTHTFDLERLGGAVRTDTTVVYVCNPNNPTGTHVSSAAVHELVDRLPENILVIVDEAYAEYVTAPDYATAIPLAMSRPNVIVTRTFSKIFGLAGLRTGYAIGQPDTLAGLSRVQAPFSVTTVAQAAALEALRYTDRLEQRVKDNAMGREWLTSELTERGVPVATSQANFVYLVPNTDPADLGSALLSQGVIVRALGPGLRVTVGTDTENERFIAAWDIAHA